MASRFATARAHSRRVAVKGASWLAMKQTVSPDETSTLTPATALTPDTLPCCGDTHSVPRG
eukprot:scaffold267719_cov35-Prasinocladus_malaysianus.AAC.1